VSDQDEHRRGVTTGLKVSVGAGYMLAVLVGIGGSVTSAAYVALLSTGVLLLGVWRSRTSIRPATALNDAQYRRRFWLQGVLLTAGLAAGSGAWYLSARLGYIDEQPDDGLLLLTAAAWLACALALAAAWLISERRLRREDRNHN
jgi:hypothetical protein